MLKSPGGPSSLSTCSACTAALRFPAAAHESYHRRRSDVLLRCVVYKTVLNKMINLLECSFLFEHVSLLLICIVVVLKISNVMKISIYIHDDFPRFFGYGTFFSLSLTMCSIQLHDYSPPARGRESRSH